MKSDRPRPLIGERIEKLPRIGTRPITNNAKFLEEIEMHALTVHDMLEEAKKKGDVYWWRYQDALDDIIDIWDYAKTLK
jgi:hypothetical protein